MIKTCKCGNIMNDSIAPNKCVYYVYSKDEWELKKKWYSDYKTDYPIHDFWYCKECGRIYSRIPIEGFFYDYCIDNEENKFDFLDNSEILELYVLNEYDDDDAWEHIKNGDEYIPFRIAKYYKRHKRIYIEVNGKITPYRVEEERAYI